MRSVFLALTLAYMICPTSWAAKKEGDQAVPSALVAETADRTETSLDDLLKLRDPFKRPSADLVGRTGKGGLELYETERYKMVGVVTGLQNLRALLKDPRNKTTIVSLGTKIGLKKGFVTRITPTSVVVRERSTNVIGQEENIDTVLELEPDKPLLNEGQLGSISR